jgi:hypothetical protein
MITEKYNKSEFKKLRRRGEVIEKALTRAEDVLAQSLNSDL